VIAPPFPVEVRPLRWPLTAAGFVVALDAMAVVATFPLFQAEFPGVAAADVAWVLNAYTLLFSALLIPAGRWADRVGHRRAFGWGVLGFGVSSVAAAIAPSLGALVVARSLQAVAAAVISPAALALLIRAAPTSGRAVGAWAAAGAAAAALGPGIGSWLAEMTSWRAMFWLNAALAAFILLFGRRSPGLAGVEAASPPADWIGAALLAGGVGFVVAGGGAMAQPGGASAVALTWLTAGGALIVGCLAWSRGRVNATLDLGLFRRRHVRVANLATLVFGAAFGVMFLAFFAFTTRVWGYSQTRAGLVAMVGPAVVIPFAMMSARLAARFGSQALIVGGGLLFAASQTWYALQLTAHPDYLGFWLPGQIASGAAIGLILPSLAAVAVEGLPPESLGVAAATNTAARQLGSVIGVAGGVGVIGGDAAGLHDFGMVYASLAGAGIVVAFLALGLNARTLRPRPGRDFVRAGIGINSVRSPELRASAGSLPP
jgi:MFS family permease